MNHKRFYSVAVITSGSDRHHISGVGHPGDPGSIPGRTFRFARLVCTSQTRLIYEPRISLFLLLLHKRRLDEKR